MKKDRHTIRTMVLAFLCALPPVGAQAEMIGEVDTAFRWLGKDDRVVIEAYDDPKVQGVTCFVSRARTGGMKGTVGLAEDRAEASIACRQVAEVLHLHRAASKTGRCFHRTHVDPVQTLARRSAR